MDTITITFDGVRYSAIAADGRQFDSVKRSQLVRNIRRRYGNVTIIDNTEGR